ncbi:uncharacterized protein [Oscarella lobularis]|uniref:uncharacterized protein n=1 Tax=Oscarella lobularis TaxID=121494 RepID=UPI0033131B03
MACSSEAPAELSRVSLETAAALFRLFFVLLFLYYTNKAKVGEIRNAGADPEPNERRKRMYTPVTSVVGETKSCIVSWRRADSVEPSEKHRYHQERERRKLWRSLGKYMGSKEVESAVLLFKRIIPEVVLEKCKTGQILLQTVDEFLGEKAIKDVLEDSIFLTKKFEEGMRQMKYQQQDNLSVCGGTVWPKFEPSFIKSVTEFYFMGDSSKWLQTVWKFLPESEELQLNSSLLHSVGERLLMSVISQPMRRLLLRQLVEFDYRCSQMRGWSRCGSIAQIIEKMDVEEQLIHMARRIHFLANDDSTELQAFTSLLEKCESKLADHNLRQRTEESKIDPERTQCHALVHDALGILYGKHPHLRTAEKLRKKLEHHLEANRLRRFLLEVRDEDLSYEIIVKMDDYASFQSQGCARSLIASSLTKKEIQNKLWGYKEALGDHCYAMYQLSRLFSFLGVSEEDRVVSPAWVGFEFDGMLRNVRYDQQVKLKEDATTENDSKKLVVRITEPLERIKHNFGCMTSSTRNKNVCLLRESMVSNGHLLMEQLLHWETKGFILDNPHINE